MIRVPYFSVDIENSNKPYIRIDTHDTFEDLSIIHPGMAMEKLLLVILHFAFIRTVVISAAITLYSVILRFRSANHATGTHIHINNNT
jgi:hypothetical protein